MRKTEAPSKRPRRKAVRSRSRYSDFQLDVISFALYAHQQYAVLSDGKGLTWVGIAEAVAVYTGVTMGEEVPRRLSKRWRKTNRTSYQETFSDENVQAIVAYLTDADIAALSSEELREEPFDYRAPVHLAQFLWKETSAGFDSLKKMTGSYVAQRYFDRVTIVVHLHIRKIDETALVRVNEEHVAYNNPRREDVLRWKPELKDRARRAHIKSNGWCVVTPEDNCLFFLEELDQLNHHYWTMACEVDLWSDEPVDRLILQRHSYPMQFELQMLYMERLTEEGKKVFERIIVEDYAKKLTSEDLMFFYRA